MPLQLKSISESVGAKIVFTVLTENAQLMAKFLIDLKNKIVLTEKEKEYVIWKIEVATRWPDVV